MRSKTTWNSSGFTLVEVVVTMGIVSLLMGILIPAVNQARAAARRTQCASRLRQIAFACTSHHDALRTLPSGTKSFQNQFAFQSWLVSVMPYVEQSQVLALSNSEYSRTLNFTEHQDFSTVFPLFCCPDDPRTSEPQTSLRFSCRVAVTSYLGCNGRDYLAKNGVLFKDSRIRWASISDGLSNTILVGERPPSTYFDLGWWYAGVGDDTWTGTYEHTIGTAEMATVHYLQCDPGPHLFSSGRMLDDCSSHHFWSTHSGGSHFAFADCSVHFMPYSSNAILNLMATRAEADMWTEDLR